MEFRLRNVTLSDYVQVLSSVVLSIALIEIVKMLSVTSLEVNYLEYVLCFKISWKNFLVCNKCITS